MFGCNVNNLLLIYAGQDSIAQGLVRIPVPQRGVGCDMYAHGLAIPHKYFLLEVWVELNLCGTIIISIKVQRSAKRLVRGCENFVPAPAYLFFLALPGSCLARFAYLLADLCSIYLPLQDLYHLIKSYTKVQYQYLPEP